MSKQSDVLLNALDQAVTPKPQKVSIPPALVRALCAGHVAKLLTKEEREGEWKPKVQEYVRVYDFVMSLTHDKAAEEFARQQESVARRVAQGLGDQVLNENHWTLAELKEEYALKRQAMVREANRIAGELDPLARRVARRIGLIAQKEAESLAAIESATSQKYGTEYGPSPVWRMLQYLAVAPEEALVSSSGSDPRRLLAFAGIQFE